VSASEQSATRLVTVAELGESQVALVKQTPHGALAVGISAGKPFAVSNRCRHLFASLGEGQVTEDGCLECPWHASRYDVGSGKMVARSSGRVQAACGRRQGDYRRHILEDVSGRAARRRNLAGRLTAGPTSSA
jgi:nitrite reductase/ring-hydroxylating ferredoxin subunit